MKSGLLFLSLLAFAGTTYAKELPGAKPPAGAVIKFESMVNDLGTMREGDVVETYFKFKNIGDQPIIIEHVEEPCGCTVPSWSKEPVMPGKTGQIKVVFHSVDRPGVIRKTLAVKTNAVLQSHEEILLMIKGNVLTKKQWRESGRKVPKKK